MGPTANAQCTLLAAPSKFDPPASGLPSYFQGRQDSLSIGGTPGAYRLAVRYNYGFLLYSLSNPGAPARVSIEDLLGTDHYPKNGDGQERVGAVALSADGTRALQPWTDTVAYGTIAMSYSGGAFLSGGDYLPPGEQIAGSASVAIAKAGSRYLGFSISAGGIYAADITDYLSDTGPNTKNGIYSEVVRNVGVGAPSGILAVEAAGRSYVVAWAADTLSVIDVSNPGTPTSGLTANFTSRTYSASQLGIPSSNFLFNGVAAARHPASGDLYLLTEGGKFSGSNVASAAVTLNRVDPTSGELTRAGTYVPPTGAKYAQGQVVLLPFDTEVVAVFLEGTDAGGLKPEVHSSADFAKNLAELIPAFTAPAQAVALAGMRASGGNVFLYLGNRLATYVASLDCSTAPSPATATLSVENVPYSGGTATTVPDLGSAFIGDQLRIKPAFSPATTVQPLLDWRLDYDFHDGNSLDSNAVAGIGTYRLKQPDLEITAGGTFLTQLTLIGPCDPAQIPQGGSAPVPSAGTGCWGSVTSNDLWTVPAGTPDFSATTPVDRQLTIGFEARNALNDSTGAYSSALAKHRITWKVPQQRLKSSSILSGGALEDLSEGSPLTTGLRWYVSSVPVGQTGADVLTLQTGCTGNTCTPSPALSQPGSYRYWVSVPYRGGFRTPECPGLLTDQVTCSGDAAKTVTVTDVVLNLTAPAQTLVGTPSLTVSSTSRQGLSVTPCPSTPGFSYNFCTLSGGSCPEGAYTSSGLSVAGPFSGAGTISIPTPAVGTWGLRVRYTYTTAGNCSASTVAQWPASGWSPLTVLQGVPTIRLRNSSNTADIPKSMGYYWDLPLNTTARLYAQLDGVNDPNPPAGLTWSRRLAGSGSETALGTTQGTSFSIATAGDYEVVLRGYGTDIIAQVGVAPAAGGGGGGTGVLSVASLTFAPTSPTAGQSVAVYCNATGGTAPYTYDIVFGDGQTYSGTSKPINHVYSASGGKTVGCAVTDAVGGFTNQYTAYLNVLPGSGSGTCEFVINNAQGARVSYDSTTRTYDAASGQPLTFVATGTTSTVNWNFGNGATAIGNNATYTYNVTQAASYTVTLTSGSCSQNYGIYISAPTGPSFTIVDATTGTALAKPTGTWEARAGQSLRFTSSGITGAAAWVFGDGETSTETSPVKTYVPLVDTTYPVKLTINGLSRQENILVKGSTGAPLTGNFTFKYSDGTAVTRTAVQPNKVIVFTAADQATTYTWDFGDGSSLATGSPKEHTYITGGNFTPKLTVARSGVPGTVVTPAPQVFTVLAPPDPLLWVAAGMAYADGQSGEKWQSDLSVYNPGTQTSTVSLGFVSGAAWSGTENVSWVQQALVAGETKSYANVLGGFFKLAKGSWGVVLVRGDTVPVAPVIMSRTYNAGGGDVTGSFGLSVPAMSVAAGVKPQSVAGANFLPDLRHDALFRTNLTVANLKDETAEVEVTFRDAGGKALGSPAKVTIEARGVKQLNAALSAAVATGDAPIGGAGWGTPESHFSAEVKLKRGSGVYPYATVIDQGTGDSIVVTPTARPSASYRLPGIVRVKGKTGNYWVSDVAILNPGAATRKVRVTFSYVKLGTTRRVEVSDVISLPPYQLAVAVDFVGFWLGLAPEDPDGYASSYVDIEPASDDPTPTEPLVVTGKTYTPSGKGSVGLQVDAFVLEDGVSAQGSRRKLVLSGLEANSRYRSNVALFLAPGSPGGIQVDVHVLDSFGRESKKFSYVGLDGSNPFVQLNSSDLFANLSTDESSRATVVIDTPRGTGYLGAYATVIDNLSEDATFVAGQPAP